MNIHRLLSVLVDEARLVGWLLIVSAPL